MRPGCDLALLLGIAHVLIAEGLYDHEFVARYTMGFDELAQAAAAWTPEWAESMCDVPAYDIRATARDLAAAAPAAVVDAGFHGGIGIAYANSTQTARAICLVDVLLGCIGHAGGALNPPTPLALGDLDPARFATPLVPREPSWGPSAIHWSIRCAACARPSVSRFLPAICVGSSSMPVTPVRAMAMPGRGYRFWNSLTCS